MNSEWDRIFEQGLSDLTRTPKTPLSDEQIAAAAKESKSGVVLWLRMHVKGILLCIVSLAVVVGGAWMVTHLADQQVSATEPEETVAAVVCDTAMGADDTGVFSGGTATTVVETQCIASLQTDNSITTSAKPNNKPAVTAVETRHGTSLQIDQLDDNPVKPNTEPAAPTVIVKKTIVQRDTIVINETVVIKDTTYVQ